LLQRTAVGSGSHEEKGALPRTGLALTSDEFAPFSLPEQRRHDDRRRRRLRGPFWSLMMMNISTLSLPKADCRRRA